MAQKYLLAIDNSDTSIRIADYLKKILNKDDKITIFSVLPNPLIIYNLNDPSCMSIYTGDKDIFKIFEENKKDIMNKIISKIMKKFTGAGLNKKNIQIKLESQCGTIPHQISDEAKKGKYNAVVMGKHNSSILSEFILGSVTHKVMHLISDIPLIIV